MSAINLARVRARRASVDGQGGELTHRHRLHRHVQMGAGIGQPPLPGGSHAAPVTGVKNPVRVVYVINVLLAPLAGLYVGSVASASSPSSVAEVPTAS